MARVEFLWIARRGVSSRPLRLWLRSPSGALVGRVRFSCSLIELTRERLGAQWLARGGRRAAAYRMIDPDVPGTTGWTWTGEHPTIDMSMVTDCVVFGGVTSSFG
jgi:hypothetical protein